MNAIHIAGTKGKGSTAAFTSSILNQYLRSTSSAIDLDKNSSPLKIGLYTSPHLRFVRERIQINGQPLGEEQFARYFFQIWDRLEQSAKEAGQDPGDVSTKPVYFRFLTLMAFHTYLSEKVDGSVIECGIGGAFDSTNILPTSVVTGITNLGIDHVGMLGGTIEEIAWHKAGIMRKGVKCFTTSSQPAEAKVVLEQVASEKGAELAYVDVHPDIANDKVKLGLEADFQKVNASLAVAMAREWLHLMGFGGVKNGQEINAQFQRGLQEVRWGGRCETRIESPNLTWYIDGGHTLDSIALAGRWFARQIQSRQKTNPARFARYLIFNQQTRDADALAKALHQTLVEALKDEVPFTHAIFCTNTTFKDKASADLVYSNVDSADLEEMRVQRQLAKTWDAIDSACHVEVVRTVEEAVSLVRQKANSGTEVTALVTGSLHLVGAFLEVIDTLEPSPESEVD